MFHPVIFLTVVAFIASLSETDARLRSSRYAKCLRARQSYMYFCRPKIYECKCRTPTVCQTSQNGEKLSTDIQKTIKKQIATNMKKIIKKEVGILKQDLIAAQIQWINEIFLRHNLKPQKPSSKKTKGKNCAELYKKGIHKSGVYQIQPFQSGPKARQSVSAYCDMTTDGGGWTVFQRRQNGHVDFYRNWAAYKLGFGNPRGEYWLGNDVLHALTMHHSSELRVDLEELSGKKQYAKYGVFSVGGARTKYKLQVGRYSGTAGDSLVYHNGLPFSTYDKDNDGSISNCAVFDHGAWWYRSCALANLNGRYNYKGVAKNEAAIIWRRGKNHKISFMKTKMMVRPRSFNQ